MIPITEIKYTPKVLLPCLTSVFFGFLVRVCLDLRNKDTTWRLILLQAGIGIGSCFGMFIAHRDYKWSISIELLLFLTSFFSVYTVSLFDRWGKFGIRNFLTLIAKRYLGEVEIEKNLEKHDNQDNGTVH